MSVSHNLTAGKVLRRSVVGVVRVGESSGLEVGDLDLEVNVRTRGDHFTARWADYDG